MVGSVVDESLGDAAEVFEGCVDGFGGAACGVGGVVRKLLTVCLCGCCPGRLV